MLSKSNSYQRLAEEAAAKAERKKQQEPAKAAPPAKPKFDYSKIYNNKILFVALAIGIFALAIYIRMGLIHDQGVFEPDGFYYLSWVRGIINNHGAEPVRLSITAIGSKSLGEAQGLPYLVVLPYYAVAWIGITYLQVMRWMPVIFGLMEMILAYLIVTRLSKSKILGLLSMFFIAVSSGNVARTAALVFRGDSFITVPLMAAIYLLILGMESDSAKKVIIYAIATAFVLSIGVIIWTGGNISTATIAVALGLLSIYAFIVGNKWLSKKAMAFIIFLGLVYILQQIYISLNAARWYSELVGTSFLVFYLPLAFLSILTYLILEYRPYGLFSNIRTRAISIGIIFLLGAAVLVIGLPGQISQLTLGLAITAAPTNSTSVNATQTAIDYAVSSTTQELQKPTFSFLYSSFGWQLFLAPIGLLLFLLFSESINADEGIHLNRTIANSNISTFIVLAAYFLAMGYLQYNAIRYNSMISIPIALFSAYAIYASINLGSRLKPINTRQAIGMLGIIILGSLLVFYWAYGISAQGLGYLSIASAAVIILLLIDTAGSLTAKPSKINMQRFALAIFMVIALFSITYGILESYSSAQADGINPAFLQAMSWMKNNTASNSVVLALWPDGSVIEGWANRTSYMDSVGGENGSRIYPFAQYLIANNSDTRYLYNISKPNYLVARYYWMTELSGLVTEGVPPQGVAAFSYEQLSPAKELGINTTAGAFIFSNGQLNVTLISEEVSNGIQYTATLSQANSAIGNIGSVRHIVFYNTSDGNYAIDNFTNSSSNYTFMVMFNGQQISAGLLVTNDLFESNLFKFLFLCNSGECSYNIPGQSATMTLVYANSDSKIFEINYTGK